MDKRYDHISNEKKTQQYWLTKDTYTIKNQNGPLYSIDTPPPTISGSLHIGHIFSYTQTDIIARYKRMSGYSVFYPFGFDDNGLPTERYVEQKQNIKGYELPRSQFIAICQQESALAAQEFKQLWQRMGISADWSHTYSTISDQTQKIAQESFIDLVSKGYIYRKNEPALYCATCCTSVAQAELDDKEIASFFNDIIFKDQQGNELIIGTTRPELLPSCVALLYNPQDSRYTHLKNKTAIVPIFNHLVPILADDQVEIEKGTGLVMCCTFGDKKDIEWFKKHTLTYRPSIDIAGKWMPHTGILAGMRVHSARTRILQELKDSNLLVTQKNITHAVNIHERCKKEIEFMLLSQWFVDILKFKNEFLAQANNIHWHPAFMKSRYINWVENISWDWCISRQRFYGIPFPVWHCLDCKTILLADKNRLPIDPQESAYNGICITCKGTNIIPDTDVMDTWNTSSLSPYICREIYNNITNKETPDFIPMSMRPQAHDIIRTWAFDTIVKVFMHNTTIPWHDIVISGHVLSDEKEKLSKSKNQKFITPENLLSQYPADVIRYWTASGSLGQDVAFSENKLKIGLRLITKLWNAFLFIKEHTEQHSFTKDSVNPASIGSLNQWIVHNLNTTYSNYKKYHDQYEFNPALTKVEDFFWHLFCDNYIELIKHQLCNQNLYTKEEVLATKHTLYIVGLRILQLFAPYLPHLTETIYNELYKNSIKTDSIHLTLFNDYQSEKTYKDAHVLGEQIIKIVTHVRTLKTQQQLSLKTVIASLNFYGNDMHLHDQLKKHEQLLQGITHATIIKYGTNAPDITGIYEDNGHWHITLVLERQIIE